MGIDNTFVVPAEAGTQENNDFWIPAYAGMTLKCAGMVLKVYEAKLS